MPNSYSGILYLLILAATVIVLQGSCVYSIESEQVKIEKERKDLDYEKFDSFKLFKIKSAHIEQVSYIKSAIEHLESWIEIHNLNKQQEILGDESEKLNIRRNELSELGHQIKARYTNILNVYDGFHIERISSVDEFYKFNPKIITFKAKWESNNIKNNFYTTGKAELSFMQSNISQQILKISERRLKLQTELSKPSSTFMFNAYTPFYLYTEEFGMTVTNPPDLALYQHDELIKNTRISDMYFKVAEISLMNLKEILGILTELNELGYFTTNTEKLSKIETTKTEKDIEKLRNKLLTIMLNYRQLMEKTKSVYGSLTLFVYVVRKAHFIQERTSGIMNEVTRIKIQDMANTDEINELFKKFRQRIQTYEHIRKSFFNGKSPQSKQNKDEL